MSRAPHEGCAECTLHLVLLLRQFGMVSLLERYASTGAVVGLSATEALAAYFRVHHKLGHPSPQQVADLTEEWRQSDDPRKRYIIQTATDLAQQFDQER